MKWRKRICIALLSLLLTLLAWMSTTMSSTKVGRKTPMVRPICPGPERPGEKTQPGFDILSFPRPEYIGNFRNPCWYGHSFPDDIQSSIRCIPVFYIVGQPKCGTTDLFSKLSAHPDIADKTAYSAVHWLSRGRFKQRLIDAQPKYRPRVTFDHYASRFRNSTNQVERKVDLSSNIIDYHPMIIGDHSPSTFADNQHWQEYVGNENCEEPRIINAHYLRHMIPEAKIILTLREPVSRLYSSYCYFLGDGTPEAFHESVVRETKMYTDCFKRHSVRRCAYDNTLSGMSDMKVGMGLYSVYLEDWFQTFPRKQVYVSFLENYSKEPESTLEEMFRFLGVSPLSRPDIQHIANATTRNIGKVRKKSLPMLAKTKALLDKFYEPFNTRLTDMLKEEPNWF
ncbi:carbohydrate sulfotransferase 15-like [Haliotis rufescens]|uniref:carbohydrate sulfotransferase 15-like n=1 Tax=Haliotis rufescens TaxID=6454 RepID=UPI00201EA7A2|nr:carbohydrate sulfotransferase 15-like [Haliotis rufescens]